MKQLIRNIAACALTAFTTSNLSAQGTIEITPTNVTFTSTGTTTGTMAITFLGRQGATYSLAGTGGLFASNLRYDLVIGVSASGTITVNSTSPTFSSVNTTILTGGVSTGTTPTYGTQGTSPVGTNATIAYQLTRNNPTDPDLPAATGTKATLFTATYPYTITSGSTVTSNQIVQRTATGNRGSSWSSFSASGNAFVQGTAVALPIDLTEFDATNNGDGRALLNWETASEQNSSYFEVERSVNGDNFNTVVSKVRAAGKSSSSLKYQSYDLKPVFGANYYRLKMVDLEGKTAYSAVRKVIFSGDQQGALSVYPTDNHDGIVNVSLPQGLEGAQIKVINAVGQVINAPADGIALMRTVNIAGLPAGIYMLQVADKGMIQSFRVSYQH